jgi:hypothetical protein
MTMSPLLSHFRHLAGSLNVAYFSCPVLFISVGESSSCSVYTIWNILCVEMLLLVRNDQSHSLSFCFCLAKLFSMFSYMTLLFVIQKCDMRVDFRLLHMISSKICAISNIIQMWKKKKSGSAFLHLMRREAYVLTVKLWSIRCLPITLLMNHFHFTVMWSHLWLIKALNLCQSTEMRNCHLLTRM